MENQSKYSGSLWRLKQEIANNYTAGNQNLFSRQLNVKYLGFYLVRIVSHEDVIC